jgi:hypothetical protein
MTAEATFGCAACYGENAEAVLAYCLGNLKQTHRLIDRNHFGVSLRACQACGQDFVTIFTEFVDWSGGEDAQYFDVVPVSPADAAFLAAKGDGVGLGELGALGAGRRHVASDWPTGAPKRISWKHGAFTVIEGD